MHRFFINRSALRNGEAFIEGDLFRHLVKVLRLKAGAQVVLADGEGSEHTGVITSLERERAVVRIEQSVLLPSPPATPGITLYQAIPKNDRMELVLQKGTELGVAEFVPVISSRTIPRLSGEKAVQRIRRWERIVMEAARQSCRQDIPRVTAIVSLAEALATAYQEVRLFLWEEELELGLKHVIDRTRKPSSVAVLVGPEGGLSREDADAAVSAGFIPVSLGPRILRTETAGLAAVSILQYVWGDMAGFTEI